MVLDLARQKFLKDQQDFMRKMHDRIDAARRKQKEAENKSAAIKDDDKKMDTWKKDKADIDDSEYNLRDELKEIETATEDRWYIKRPQLENVVRAFEDSCSRALSHLR